MSEAISGVKTEIRVWDGAAWEKIGEVSAISGPTMTKETIDVTNFDSDGGYREFIASFKDGGTMTLTMNFVMANYSVLLDLFNAIGPDEIADWELNLPDGDAGALESTFFFKGIVTELPMEIPADDKVTNTCTIKISGKVYDKAAPSGAAVAPSYV